MLPRFRIWTMLKNITVKMIIIQLNSLPFPRGKISAPPEGISIIFVFLPPHPGKHYGHVDAGIMTAVAGEKHLRDEGWQPYTPTQSQQAEQRAPQVCCKECTNPQCVKWSVMVHPLGYYLRMERPGGDLGQDTNSNKALKCWILWTLGF